MSVVEKTTQYATVVDTLPEAWAFVMAHVDTVGSAPAVTITPHWSDRFERHQFEVSVNGTVEQDGEGQG